MQDFNTMAQITLAMGLGMGAPFLVVSYKKIGFIVLLLVFLSMSVILFYSLGSTWRVVEYLSNMNEISVLRTSVFGWSAILTLLIIYRPRY